MSDLKEALCDRAKHKGNKGPKNSLGATKPQSRLWLARARRPGPKRRLEARPGKRQGARPETGRARAKDRATSRAATSTATATTPTSWATPRHETGKTKDEALQGVQGKGPSTRETILSAAQKGFASRAYEEVYAQYKAIVEEVIDAEKVPSGYKHYVKRYFQKIKPN